MSLPQQHTRPDFPGDAAEYFKSPISVLLESLEDGSAGYVSSHDLVEAYTVFSNRIRTVVTAMPEDQHEIPALKYIVRYAQEMARCLSRDVHRALEDPISDWQIRSDLTQAPLSDGISEDQLKRARDESSVCYAALHLLSYFFRFSVLSSLLPPNDVASLFDDALKIVHLSALPIPSGQRIALLATYVLSNLSISSILMSSKKQQIKDSLKAAIENKQSERCVVDGLSACHRLLAADPHTFLEPFVELLPLILAHITSSTPSIRTEVAHTLAGYVLAVSSEQAHSLQSSEETIRHHIHTFLESQRSSRNRIAGVTRLDDVLSTSLSLAHAPMAGQGPVWVSVVLASFVMLLDDDLYTHPRSLKLVITNLARFLVLKPSFIHKLHACVWRSLIWTSIHVGRNGDSNFLADRKSISASQSSSNLRDRAFRVVKQELGRGIGVALVSCLLQSSLGIDVGELSDAADDLSKALQVVKDMVAHDTLPIHIEGVALLTRLTSSIGTGATRITLTAEGEKHEDSIVVQALFDGSVLNEDPEKLPWRVGTICHFDVARVRQLSEAEILCHWEDLIESWIHCVERHPSYSQPVLGLSIDLLQVWQTLLLVQAQLIQEHGHLTTAPNFASRAVAIVGDFLACGSTKAPESSELGDRQCFRLTLAGQLWRVMKNVFASSWLVSTATSILTFILAQEYQISRDDVKAAWSELCAALICAGEPDLLGRLTVETEQQGKMDLTRHLWNLSAASWTKSEPNPSWQSAVSFLAAPLRSWNMSREEIGIWCDILDSAIRCAEPQSTTPLKVIEALVLEVAKGSKTLLSNPQVGVIILTHLRPKTEDTISAKLFSHINEFLCGMYSSKAECLQLAMDALKALTNLFKRCPQSLLIPILAALTDGLCMWVRDESEIMLDYEYNNVVLVLYSDTLDLIRGISFTSDILHALAPFLTSTFCRIVPPARGPMIFKAFWDAVYPNLGSLACTLPVALTECLKAYQTAFEAKPAELLFDDSDSQSQSQLWSDELVPKSPDANRPIYHRIAADESMNPNHSSTPTHVGAAYSEHSNGGVVSDFVTSPQLLQGTYRGHSDSRVPTSRVDTFVSRSQSEVSLSLGTSAVSPELPFVRTRLHDHEMSTEALAEWAAAPLEIVPGLVASDSICPPSSPTPAKRAFSPVDDLRQAKRVKEEAQGTASPVNVVKAGATSHGEAALVRAASPSLEDQTAEDAFPSRSWLFDEVEMPTYAEVRRVHSSMGSALPLQTPAGPEPTTPRQSSSIVRAATPVDDGESASRRTPGAVTPSSEDYESWEISVDPAEVQHIQRSMHSLVDTEPDGGFSDEANEYRFPRNPTTIDKGKGKAKASSPNITHDDIIFSSSLHKSNIQSTGHPASPERSRTAPALLSRAPDPDLEAAPPLRRTRSTSVHVEALQQVYQTLLTEGHQMPVDDMLAASKLVHEIGGMLNEQLLRRLGDADKGGK